MHAYTLPNPVVRRTLAVAVPLWRMRRVDVDPVLSYDTFRNIEFIEPRVCPHLKPVNILWKSLPIFLTLYSSAKTAASQKALG